MQLSIRKCELFFNILRGYTSQLRGVYDHAGWLRTHKDVESKHNTSQYLQLMGELMNSDTSTFTQEVVT